MNDFEKDNIIKVKSYKFALRIIKLYKYLVEEKKEYVLSRQLLRSGTSIGANVEEAIGGISKKDFINKIYIVYKEARETRYWINLLKDSDYFTDKASESLLNDCEEIIKLSGKIISSSKKSVPSTEKSV
ncbi:MAG: four helix bundle protein [Ignavibacteria bacterium]|jgi:four helix bundle protein